MPGITTKGKAEVNRAAIYARVSDKSQDGEDKTSISEQIGEMEALLREQGAHHHGPLSGGGQRVDQKAPRVPEDAGRRQEGTLRHHRLREVRPPQPGDVPRRRPHGDSRGPPDSARLMAAIGKIELDNFRERSTIGDRLMLRIRGDH